MAKAINERLKELRQREGLTIEEVAQRIGIQKPTISVLETGKQIPSLKTMQRYADAIGYAIEINFVRKGEECQELALVVDKEDKRNS